LCSSIQARRFRSLLPISFANSRQKALPYFEEYLLVSKALPTFLAPHYFCACSDLSLCNTLAVCQKRARARSRRRARFHGGFGKLLKCYVSPDTSNFLTKPLGTGASPCYRPKTPAISACYRTYNNTPRSFADLVY
jgi:hypothetical protein